MVALLPQFLAILLVAAQILAKPALESTASSFETFENPEYFLSEIQDSEDYFQDAIIPSDSDSEILDGFEMLELMLDDEDSDEIDVTPELVPVSSHSDLTTRSLEKLIRNTRKSTPNFYIQTVPMCSNQMGTITRQAKMAAALLVSNYQYTRRSRSIKFNSQNFIRKNPGTFCKSLYNKLKRVHFDISIIEKNLTQKFGNNHVFILKSTIQQLKESLQEMMNQYGTPYNEQDFNKRTNENGKSLIIKKLGVNGIKNRAETGIDSLVSTLNNLNTGCQRLKRQAGFRYQ